MLQPKLYPRRRLVRRAGIKSIFTLVIMPLIMYDCTVVLFEASCRPQNTAYGAYRAVPAYAVGKDVVLNL